MVAGLFKGFSARLPSQCLVCHAWPAQAICERCVSQFAQPVARCRTCALAVPPSIEQCGTCMRQHPALDACFAAVAYAYPWSGLVLDFKFHAQPGLAAALALLLRSAPWVEPALDGADLVLPMPLSRERLRARGFNQALLLARQLAPDKADSQLLLRLRDTPAQHTLGRTERLTSLAGAFAVDPLGFDRLRDARVVLVDDVMTSGASLFTAAQTLRQAGAVHITGLVIARTPND
jgi:ComF family protein